MSAMKQRIKKEIIIFIAIAVAVIILLIFTMGWDFFQKDIQFHDTYFDPTTFIVLLITPIVVLVFLIRGIVQRFRNEGTNLILLGSFLFASCVLIGLFNMYFDFKMDLKNGSENEVQIERINGKLIWTACEIIALVMASVLLGVRTMKLVKRAT